MRNVIVKRLILTAILLGGAFVGPTHAACSAKPIAGSAKTVPSIGINQALLDRLITEQVNLERCKRGLTTLKMNAGLRKQAAVHARWMASSRKLSHKATSGSSRRLKDRLRASGLRFRTGAENLGMVAHYNIDGRRFLIRAPCQFTTTSRQPIGHHSYHSLARLIVREWMASPGHRKNVLARKMRYVGTAAAIQPRTKHCGAVFLTQIFAG